ncbi:MAG: RNA polymerase sigma factor, partial [Acidimicrobiia bacterium]
MRVSALEDSSDEDLLGAFVDSGDRDALQVLIRRHENRVYGLAFRILGDPNDALDATQDVFILTFRKAKTFRREAAFTTWLYRLTTNACRDLGRKKARTPVPVEEVQAESVDRADSAEDRIVVEQALRRLPADQREAIVLREIGGLSYEQIGETLKVPVGTVKSRIARGRLALGQT